MSSLLGSSGAVAAAAVGAAPAGGAGDVGVPAGWQPGAAQAGGDGRAVRRLSGGEGGGHPRGAAGAPGVVPGGGEPVAGGGPGAVRGDGGHGVTCRSPSSSSGAASQRTVNLSGSTCLPSSHAWTKSSASAGKSVSLQPPGAPQACIQLP